MPGISAGGIGVLIVFVAMTITLVLFIYYREFQNTKKKCGTSSTPPSAT